MDDIFLCKQRSTMVSSFIKYNVADISMNFQTNLPYFSSLFITNRVVQSFCHSVLALVPCRIISFQIYFSFLSHGGYNPLSKKLFVVIVRLKVREVKAKLETKSKYNYGKIETELYRFNIGDEGRHVLV
jgi:hypothetical protein